MEEYKKQVLVTLIGFIVISGFSLYAGTQMAIKGTYSGDDFDAFKAGYHDSYLTLIGNFISNCTPSNVVVYQSISFKNEPIGLLYRCEKVDMNVTLPLKYSKFMR